MFSIRLENGLWQFVHLRYIKIQRKKEKEKLRNKYETQERKRITEAKNEEEFGKVAHENLRNKFPTFSCLHTNTLI